jgi:hypothetical protein
VAAAGSSLAVEKSWHADDGSFNNPANWTPPGVPGIADVARLGNLPTSENSQVTIDAPVAVLGLEISDGIGLVTTNGALAVLGNTTAHGINTIPPDFGQRLSTLFVNNVAAAIDYSTLNFEAYDSGRLWLDDNAFVQIGGQLHLSDDSAAVRGSGTINFTGAGTTLINEGLIFSGGDGMVLQQSGGGVYDLDGVSGDGRLSVVGSDTVVLNISGTSLTDTFSGSIGIGAGDRLHMNLSSSWTADANSEIGAGGDNDVSGPSRLTGADFTLGGTVTINSSQAHLYIEPNTTILPTAHFKLYETGQLEFTGATRIEGGSIETHSNTSADGSVDFAGVTEWDGTLTVDGVASQVGPATVVGPTTITANVFDMDGLGGTDWDFASSAVIHAESIDSTISNTFDGTLNLGGGFVGELTINLTGSFDEWTMNGELNLTGAALASFPIDRLGGSRMRVTGDVIVEHRVRVSAEATFAHNSEVTFADAQSRVQFTGTTFVDSGAAFHGDGTLENGVTGELTLADGVSLGGVGLSNRGLLQIGDSPGSVAVDRFQNFASGTWLVEIGGLTPATEFDRLLMGGAATLDGQIEVDLIDLGSGDFLPEIGDTFTVLTAFAGVTGTFQNSPVSLAAGQQFHWSVIYTPQDVILELVDITPTVPEPASVALLAIPLALAGTNRRYRSIRERSAVRSA